LVRLPFPLEEGADEQAKTLISLTTQDHQPQHQLKLNQVDSMILVGHHIIRIRKELM
jgi:hypothetical protein